MKRGAATFGVQRPPPPCALQKCVLPMAGLAQPSRSHLIPTNINHFFNKTIREIGHRVSSHEPLLTA
eukprot:1195740-Prorocentrum_minimum.AAC.3